MSNRSEVTGKKLTSNAMCARYGITRRTLARWMVDPNLNFPPSLLIAGRHYWEEADTILWERACVTKRAA